MPGSSFDVLAGLPESGDVAPRGSRKPLRKGNKEIVHSRGRERGGRERRGETGSSSGRAAGFADRSSSVGQARVPASKVPGGTRNFEGNGNGGAGAKMKRPYGSPSLPKWTPPAQTVVISEPSAVGPAVTILSKESRVAVDCEGVALSRTGALCLVQLASSRAVYIFDIAVGGRALFDAGLRGLLESPKCLKVLHDCRHDCDALLWQFDLRLGPVLDTQVAFSVLREVRNMKVGLPVSLRTLLLKFVGVRDGELAVKEGIKSRMRDQEDFWLVRPLPPDALQYARFDVVYLLHVAKIMAIHITSAVGPADERGWSKVLSGSKAYAALFRDDADGPRKEGARWARLVTEAKAEQAIRDRRKAAHELQEADPMRTFKLDCASLLECFVAASPS